MKKQFGILCHVSSLDSEFGIGDFGKASFDFVDFLSQNSINVWSILPLSETNEHNCPYGSHCSFALDSRFVDLEGLLSKGLIEKNDLQKLKANANTKKVNYAFVVQEKNKLLDTAYSNLPQKDKKLLEIYTKNHKIYYEFAYFKTLLQVFDTNDWRKLQKKYICADEQTKFAFVEKYKDVFLKFVFIQKILHEQWAKVKKYANSKNIKIIGDLPIYCEPTSFDVFFAPEYYKLDKQYNPTVLGGVPGDDFKKSGQNWGTCIYNWQRIAKENYKFFVDKISNIFSMYDIVRLDHFNGYCDHFEIEATSKDNVFGKWVKAGGKALFAELEKHFNLNKFVVEDLGNNRPDSIETKNAYNLTGMSVLQFANSPKSAYLPQNASKNTVFYLGTHDNNTFVGFLNSLNSKQKSEFCNLVDVKKHDNKTVAIECMKKVLQTKCKFKIFTAQDLLFQDSSCRMNTPGQTENCWDYKLPKNYKTIISNTIKLLYQ